jgi:outer membrane protein
MKRLGTIVLFILTMTFVSNAQAQKLKLGHVHVDSIFQVMPERATAELELREYQKQIEDQLMTMNSELETKYNDYLENSEVWTKTLKQDKEEELTSLQQRIQNFQVRAQTDLQTKESELLAPIYTKITTAINDVSKEHEFTYVFDASMLLFRSDDSINLTEKVKSKLGL